MKTAALITCGLLLFACPALAGGLDLAWDTCAIEGGLSDALLDCASGGMPRSIYATFVTGTDLPEFDRLSFVMDFEVDAPTLPDFWLFAATTGQIGTPSCNIIDHESFPATVCPHAPSVLYYDPVFELPSEYTPYIGGIANRGRLVGTVVRGQEAPPLTLQAGKSYFAFRVRIYLSLATEAGGPCAACPTPAAIVLNQITLWPGQGPPVVLTGPAMVSNCVTAGGGGAVPCGATPTRPSTWGSIKALYR